MRSQLPIARGVEGLPVPGCMSTNLERLELEHRGQLRDPTTLVRDWRRTPGNRSAASVFHSPTRSPQNKGLT